MSYDIWLEADLGGEERVDVGVLPDWNYTSNVSPMWRKAMPETDGLAGLEGMRAGHAAKSLAAGIERMEADPSSYRAMNPDNGWGDFDSQLERLKVLLVACQKAPDAYVGISR